NSARYGRFREFQSAAAMWRRRSRALELGEVVSRAQKLLVQPRLGGTRLGMPVVVPSHQRRQGHQNRFGAAAGLQTEQGAAVVNQIEFHVAAAPIQLKAPLALAERLIPAPFQDGQVGG